MVIAVKCACGKGLKLNETYAGKKVKCPGCSQILRVPSPQTPAAPHQAAGRNLQHSRTAQQANSRNTPANKPGWQTGGNSLLAAVGFAVPEGLPAVNKGAKIAIYATIVSIAAPLLLMLVGFLVPGAGVLGYVVSVACMVCILVGYFCCLQVPAEPKAKPLITIACLCVLLGTLGGLVLNAVTFLPMTISIYIGILFQPALLAVSFASFGLFLLFIRRVANWLKQSNVAQEAMLNFYLLIAFTAVTLITQGVVSYMAHTAVSVINDVAPLAQQGPAFEEIVTGSKNSDDRLKNMEEMATQFEELHKSVSKKIPSETTITSFFIITAAFSLVGLVLVLALIIRLIILMGLIDFRLPTKSHGAGSYRPGRNAGR